METILAAFSENCYSLTKVLNFSRATVPLSPKYAPTFSFSASSEDVASSSMRILGFLATQPHSASLLLSLYTYKNNFSAVWIRMIMVTVKFLH